VSALTVFLNCPNLCLHLRNSFASRAENTFSKVWVYPLSRKHLRYVGNACLSCSENNCLPMSLQWKRLCPLFRKWRFRIESTIPAFGHSVTILYFPVSCLKSQRLENAKRNKCACVSMCVCVCVCARVWNLISQSKERTNIESVCEGKRCIRHLVLEYMKKNGLMDSK
jgi:hypothetical protein